MINSKLSKILYYAYTHIYYSIIPMHYYTRTLTGEVLINITFIIFAVFNVSRRCYNVDKLQLNYSVFTYTYTSCSEEM